MMKIVWSFIVGGGICVISQIMMDKFRMTPAHTTCTLVVIGAILGGFGWYDPLVKFAGMGASLPISSFGNSLVQGTFMEIQEKGAIGIFTGIFEMTSSGVAAALIFAFAAALIFKSKG